MNIKEIDNSDLMELLETTSKKEFYRLTLDHELVVRLYNWITNLQKENEHLRTQVNTYENPDDYTLFYMWLDTRAKDKMKQLQKENEKLKEEIENLTHIVANKIIEDYDIDTPLKDALNEERIKYINLGIVCNDYKSRCEKALDKLYCFGEVFDGKILQKFQKEMENILNGGDEE